jgi:hypothetical protein
MVKWRWARWWAIWFNVDPWIAWKEASSDEPHGMLKDSKKYASTGGWGFAQFTDGKPDGEAVHKTCFACHSPAKDRDLVFTRYSR